MFSSPAAAKFGYLRSLAITLHSPISYCLTINTIRILVNTHSLLMEGTPSNSLSASFHGLPSLGTISLCDNWE